MKSYNPEIKIYSENLGRSPEEIFSFFGDWIQDVDHIRSRFLSSEPFPFVQIENFLSSQAFDEIVKIFPAPNSEWHFYQNPLEIKYALDSVKKMPGILQELLFILNEQPLVDLLRKISEIPDLEIDPYLHGSGLHSYPHGGRLDIHLDYNVHPITGRERRLNLIVYVHPRWEEGWGGSLELWNSSMKECGAKVQPVPNSAILFSTSEESFHGMPEPISCPSETYRQSIAVFYVSPFRSKIQVRPKATFFARPQDIYDERMEKLRRIRSNRRITAEDLSDIWPDYTT